MNEKKIKLTINEMKVDTFVSKNQTLLNFIRNDLNLTGTKEGCGTGDCGSCVVLIDGQAMTTCNILAHKVNGCNITTIEGLSKNHRLHPIQEAFVEAGAIQCGYCTPGMVLQTKALLDKNPKPTMDEIKVAISGHICRCTGYIKIVDAIVLASDKLLSSDK